MFRFNFRFYCGFHEAAKQGWISINHGVVKLPKPLFPQHRLAEIVVQTVRVFYNVIPNFMQLFTLPWPPRTYRNVRVAFLERAQVPVLWSFVVISWVHSFLLLCIARREGEKWGVLGVRLIFGFLVIGTPHFLKC